MYLFIIIKETEKHDFKKEILGRPKVFSRIKTINLYELLLIIFNKSKANEKKIEKKRTNV